MQIQEGLRVAVAELLESLEQDGELLARLVTGDAAHHELPP